MLLKCNHGKQYVINLLYSQVVHFDLVLTF